MSGLGLLTALFWVLWEILTQRNEAESIRLDISTGHPPVVLAEGLIYV